MDQHHTSPVDLKQSYGDFYNLNPQIQFNLSDVPQSLHHLIPYAMFWGISDDLDREHLVLKAPEAIKHELKNIVVDNDDLLDEWLAGEEADSPPTDAYVAFSAMRMAADFM